MTERFRTTDPNTFFADFVYDRVVPSNHFLRRLREQINWDELSRRVMPYYKGGAEYGPVPYHPAMILRMLFLSYLYNLSARQTEDLVNSNLAAKYFIGLAVYDPAPDHSTLAVFKRRLVARGHNGDVVVTLLHHILMLAQEQGIKFGTLQVFEPNPMVDRLAIQRKRRRNGPGQLPTRNPAMALSSARP